MHRDQQRNRGSESGSSGRQGGRYNSEQNGPSSQRNDTRGRDSQWSEEQGFYGRDSERNTYGYEGRGGRGAGRGGDQQWGYDSGYDRDLDSEMETGGYSPRNYRNDRSDNRGEGFSSGSRGKNDVEDGFDSSSYRSSGYGPDQSWSGRSQQGQYSGRGPKGYRRSDERIEEEVNEVLTRDASVDASEIEIQVKNGEVTLSGMVDSRDAKRRAEDLIEDVLGVVNVQNQLRIGSWSTSTGSEQRSGASGNAGKGSTDPDSDARSKTKNGGSTTGGRDGSKESPSGTAQQH